MSKDIAENQMGTFKALNGLRFLAALAVVFFHYAPLVEHYTDLASSVRNLINEGPAAVAFFFILSGFVLACRHSQYSRLKTAASFYWARLVRLYPTYLVAFILFLPIAVQKYLLIAHPPDHRTFFLSAAVSYFMLQAWTPLAQSWNGPSWSLSVEAFMYLTFPLIALRLLRLSSKRFVWILVAGWLVPAGLAGGYVFGVIPGEFWIKYVRNNPLLWLPFFLIGICGTRFIPVWTNVPRRAANVISTVALFAVIAIALVWPANLTEVFITGGITPLLLAVVICFTRKSGFITKVIGSDVLNRLGQVSYHIYILQAPAWHYWHALTNHIRHLAIGTSTVASWQFLSFLPLLILLAFAVQHFAEIPVQKWLEHRKIGIAMRLARCVPTLKMLEGKTING